MESLQESLDMNVDLSGNDESFKDWFKVEIERVLNMEKPNSNSIVYLSLDIDESSNYEAHDKIRDILSVDKAIDLSQSDSPENIIQFLRESVYDLYNKHLNIESLNRLHERYQQGDYRESNDRDEIYAGLLESIANHTKWLTHFSQKFPGFHKFDTEDLSVLVASGTLCLYGFYFRDFYQNNDNQLILANNILYTRARMNLLFEKNLIDLVFLFINKMHGLNLTECERALFYPLILLSCDVKLVKAKDYLLDLKKYYRNTLINEFKMNNRDESFSKKLIEFFKVSVVIEINKLNYQANK